MPVATQRRRRLVTRPERVRGALAARAFWVDGRKILEYVAGRRYVLLTRYPGQGDAVLPVPTARARARALEILEEQLGLPPRIARWIAKWLRRDLERIG